MSTNTLQNLPSVAPAPIIVLAPPLHASLQGRARFFKRAIDVVGALCALVLLAPVLLLVAIAIKLDSSGPVIFRQRRVGLNGREFDMYKFRSMARDAEARKAELMALNEVKDGPIFKMKHDPRVTRVGRFIRRTSLDEFPQFVNVLLGQMSLVGPRPPVPEEVARYTPEQWQRLSVMPGATGLWQVSGRSELSSFRSMLALDLQYIRGWSLRQDILILLKTVKVILRMEGAC
ncbi:exopolysaccharide biosynthesis polyprenyl glycosylphosphotransferase [bacterium]|nr:exopolysaccharide biosynthesis polyprenyl glycosylphosphotransferase [bacterium]